MSLWSVECCVPAGPLQPLPLMCPCLQFYERTDGKPGGPPLLLPHVQIPHGSRGTLFSVDAGVLVSFKATEVGVFLHTNVVLMSHAGTTASKRFQRWMMMCITNERVLLKLSGESVCLPCSPDSSGGGLFLTLVQMNGRTPSLSWVGAAGAGF